MGLDTVELVMAIEEEFGISIPDDVAPNLVRLGDLQAFAVRALRARGESVDPSVAWERVKAVVRSDFGIREKYLVPEAHIVHDLGLD
jgi:acyl carrier protein